MPSGSQLKMMKRFNYSRYLFFCTGLVLTALIVILMTAVLTGGEDAEPVGGTTATTEAPVEPTTEDGRRDGFFTLLIAGTDSDRTRTDTILLVALDTNNGTASVLSIPRDTRAYAADGSIHKINAAHNKGIDRMLTEIKNTVGFTPDRYVILDYEVFRIVIDALGGVTVDVPMDMDYSDPTQNLEIHLEAGEQLLDGEHALQYMRFRSGYADADLGRIKAQQKLFAALAEKLKSAAAVKLLTKIPTILDKVETNLTAGEMLWLGTKALKIDTSALSIDTLPGQPLGADYDASRSKTMALINEKYNPYTEPITSLNIP